ncbi:MAG: hydrolase [Candidatus Micrarchaeota archaeon]
MAKGEKKSTEFETGCCKRFEPAKWDGKELVWKNRLFLRDHVTSVFHIPINMDKVIVKNMDMITKAGALDDEQLMLSDEKSMWGSDIFIAVTKEVPGAKMERISGTFLTKVFEGPYQDMGKWVREMGRHVESKGKKQKQLYFYYTMCPACAKAYGQNFTVLVAQV